MTALIPFAFEDHLVRVVKPNGEPWFVGKDVCDVLEISKHHQALDRLDPDERGTYNVGTPGGEQAVICVSEPGVYRLIFTSRKPEAERFKRWLAHEVLPELRKRGSYGNANPSTEPVIEFPVEDRALSEHMAKLATLRECRMIHGGRAAARLWKRLGMPAVEDSRIYEADDGRACLSRLLTEEIPLTETISYPIWTTIESALDGNDVARLQLKGMGIAIADDSTGAFAVANRHPFLFKLFESSPWADGRWRAALRRLPGALPSQRFAFEGKQMRAVVLPGELLDSFSAPTPSGGNVVPLKP